MKSEIKPSVSIFLASVTNDHKLYGLKQKKFIFSPGLESRGPRYSYQKDHIPSKVSGKNPSCLSASGGSGFAPGLWQYPSLLGLCLCMNRFSALFSVSGKDTLIFRTCPNSV